VLEQSEISHYLLSLGLVKPRAIRDEELVVDRARLDKPERKEIVGNL